ncbi:Na+/proline symporter [Paenibacillus endophyticus]|uniref:Na+/proline symporter n=1 Tax=Paenibacillus endophyticus TaxID=1294268 RepID=A0A7W5GB69_9BACL|nr:hypothetical protein [Paenibacillus endophyticus]MBB3153491.1 Na+/proline symporter [Paenibacillus endophyticus]
MKNKSINIVLLFISLAVLLLAFTGKDLIEYHAVIGWGGFIVLTSINIVLLIKNRCTEDA